MVERITQSKNVAPAIGSTPRRFDRRDRDGEADRESPREDKRQDEVPAFELRGIPAADLGPEARAAFVRMMEDFERLRAEVRWGRDKIGGLEKRGDQHDYLPIANRRAFLRKLEEVARHRRHLAEGASLILVHVGIGDAARRELGLTAHDRLMEHVAGALVAMVHPTDTVAALGGHDFGILLILGSSRAAEVKRHDVIEGLKRSPFKWEGADHHLRPLVGVVALDRPESAMEALLEADRDLMAQAVRADDETGKG